MNAPHLERLRAALVAIGAPPPTDLEPVPVLGSGATRVRLGDADWVVWVVGDGPARAPERAQLAGVRWSAKLPIPWPVAALRQGLEVPGVVQPLPSGSRPASVLEPAEAGRAVGRALAVLAGVSEPRRGTIPGPSSFLPAAVRWSDEVTQAAARDHAWAVAHGLDLGERSRELLAVVTGAAAALDAGTRAVPVHGLLSPRAVLVKANGDLAGILAWDRALAGDPEQDWAPLVLGDGLDVVVEGFGEASFRALFADEAARARLEAHAAAFVLGRLADLVDDPPAVRGERQDRLAALAEIVVTGRLSARIDAPATPVARPAGRALLRAALAALADQGEPRHGERAAGAVAAALLAERFPAHAGALHRLGWRAIGGLPPPRSRAVTTEPGSEQAVAAVVAEGLAAEPVLAQAAATWWVGSTALAALRPAASAHLVHGLRSHVVALCAARDDVLASVPDADPRAAALRAVVHGVMGAAGRSVDDPVRQRLLDHAARGASLLRLPELAESGFDGGAEAAVARLAERESLDGPAVLLPVFLLAHAAIGGEIGRWLPASVLLEAF